MDMKKFNRFIPVVLVVVGWIAFVMGVCSTHALTKIALLALARILP